MCVSVCFVNSNPPITNVLWTKFSTLFRSLLTLKKANHSIYQPNNWYETCRNTEFHIIYCFYSDFSLGESHRGVTVPDIRSVLRMNEGENCWGMCEFNRLSFVWGGCVKVLSYFPIKYEFENMLCKKELFLVNT